MSTSRAIKPKRDDKLLPKWESMPERAPSIVQEDSPTVARVLAMIGLFFFVLGALAMSTPLWREGATIISPGYGFLLATLGLCPILYHCFVERDFQFRRLYGFLALGLIVTAVLLRLLAFKTGTPLLRPMGLSGSEVFHYFGVPGLFLGLIILIGVIRNETDAYFRALLMNLVGGVGALMLVFGVLNGLRDINYLPGEGLLMLVMGLLFFSTYIGLQETHNDRGYQAALALGALGIVGFAAGLLRSLMPESQFFVPAGLILMGMSLVFGAISLGICVDWPIVVLTRRELAAYFFSPVAYLVFVGQLIFAWVMFIMFVENIARGGLLEPITTSYIIDIIPVFAQMFFVPALTMRLLSEEQRSGTLEVLLTAPVNEVTIVLGKFFAVWILYMLLWLPWWLFLVSLRYLGHEEFDYRPILSFTVALASISAGFLSMGLFFSSLTTNQIVAAVFTFVGVMAQLVFYLFQRYLAQSNNPLIEVLIYINFLDFWVESLRGTLSPRHFIFHVSVTVFFLFGTIKVLESRKWK